MTYEFSQITSLLDLKKRRNEWNSLFQRCGNHFYQEWDWYFGLRRYLIKNIEFIFIENQGELVGILPITFDRKTKVLSLPYCSQTDLVDCLFDVSKLDANFLWKLKSYLDANYRNWKFLENRRLLEDSCSWILFSNKQLRSDIDPSGKNSYFVTVSESDLRISGKQRRNVTRNQRHLYNCNLALSFEFCASDQESIRDFLVLEDKGWKGKNGRKTSILSDTENVGFYKFVANSFATSNKLNVCRFRVGDKTIASNLTVLNRNIQYIIKTSYDPGYRVYSPGSILLLNLLNYAVESETRNAVNLVTGPQWADRWHPESRPIYWGKVFNDNLAGNLAWFGIRLKDRVRRVINSRVFEFSYR